MNFGEARIRLTETTSLSIEDNTRMAAFLNEAIADFARDAMTNPVRVSFPTVVGQTDYNLQSLLLDSGPSNGVIKFLYSETFDAARGYPLEVRGLATVVLPSPPTAIVSIKGVAIMRPALFVLYTDDATDLPFPYEYHRAVLYRAQQLACEWDRQDDTEIAKWEAKYENEVAKARRARLHIGPMKTLSASRQLSPFGPSTFPWDRA